MSWVRMPSTIPRLTLSTILWKNEDAVISRSFGGITALAAYLLQFIKLRSTPNESYARCQLI